MSDQLKALQLDLNELRDKIENMTNTIEELNEMEYGLHKFADLGIHEVLQIFLLIGKKKEELNTKIKKELLRTTNEQLKEKDEQLKEKDEQLKEKDKINKELEEALLGGNVQASRISTAAYQSLENLLKINDFKIYEMTLPTHDVVHPTALEFNNETKSYNKIIEHLQLHLPVENCHYVRCYIARRFQIKNRMYSAITDIVLQNQSSDTLMVIEIKKPEDWENRKKAYKRQIICTLTISFLLEPRPLFGLLTDVNNNWLFYSIEESNNEITMSCEDLSKDELLARLNNRSAEMHGEDFSAVIHRMEAYKSEQADFNKSAVPTQQNEKMSELIRIHNDFSNDMSPMELAILKAEMLVTHNSNSLGEESGPLQEILSAMRQNESQSILEGKKPNISDSALNINEASTNKQ